MVAKDVDENPLDYRCVWTGGDRDLYFTNTQDEKTLESVFNYFNENEPNNFAGRFRSLSIGDVVCLEDRCYLCQTVGWRRFENFAADKAASSDSAA